jgi:transketolase
MTRVMGFTWTVADHDLLSTTDLWGDALVDLARADERIVAVTADLATTTKLARLKRELPERCINVGVAEQNLVAVAAGLAAAGLVPVVVTYATFAALRAAEFVRTDLAYDARNVKIVAALAGVAFGQGGPTHHGVEDLALMRAIPGMTVLSPSDGAEMVEALHAAIAYDGPVYIRWGRGTEEPIAGRPPFAIGRVATLRPGDDVTIFATGTPVGHAVRASERLARHGVGARVVAVPSLKPFDEAAVYEAATATRRVVTVEDHNVIGGLGSAVADALVARGASVSMRKLGHQDRWLGAGVPEDLMHAGGFDEDAIVLAASALVGRVPPRDAWPEEALA